MATKKQKIKEAAKRNKSAISGMSGNKNFNGHVIFSFKEIDSSQHLKETFECWAKENLLLKLLNRIKDISQMTMNEATNNQVIKNYGSFPPSSKTEYMPPKSLSEELQWASLHIQGKEVIAGRIVENTFYIVFLDREHKFWISEKKHT